MMYIISCYTTLTYIMLSYYIRPVRPDAPGPRTGGAGGPGQRVNLRPGLAAGPGGQGILDTRLYCELYSHLACVYETIT